MKINKILGKYATKATVMAFVLAGGFVMASCSDDNNDVAPKDGNPQIDVAAVSPALFGDSITVNVKCARWRCAIAANFTGHTFYNGRKDNQYPVVASPLCFTEIGDKYGR